jgi:hypothetical protein
MLVTSFITSKGTTFTTAIYVHSNTSEINTMDSKNVPLQFLLLKPFDKVFSSTLAFTIGNKPGSYRRFIFLLDLKLLINKNIKTKELQIQEEITHL